MDFDLAVRLTEILLAFAFIVQSLEHLLGFKSERLIFILRLVFSLALVAGFYTPIMCAMLFMTSIVMLHLFQGPYNGGSDRMGILILSVLCCVHFLPSIQWKDCVFGYLALQLILSYFISGWVKIVNPEWRNGRALMDVFEFSAYPVSESIRKIAHYPKLVLIGSWVVIGFEIVFPLAFLTQMTLIIGLGVAATFHLANAFLFGLNRFFWVWIAAYPSILWLHDRIF